MNSYAEAAEKLNSPEIRARIGKLYGDRNGMTDRQIKRYGTLLERFRKEFPEQEVPLMISAPGRTEIGGNHTDHNNGRVLAAAVNLDTLAAVAPRKDMTVCLHSEGYRPLRIDLTETAVREKEKGTTSALIRGVAAGMLARGYRIGGFDAAVTSTVASGSGLSSSAAFEVLICAILDRLYNGNTVPFAEKAKISRYAENAYFGKPSGLLDQTASAAGGLVAVDFGSEEPEIRAMSFDFAKAGYALAVVATGGSHADLTDCYASIPAEMKAVAAELGGKVLRDIPEEQFTRNIGRLRAKLGDRPVMRAMHFYRENGRALQQAEALLRNDLQAFMNEIRDSGRSSFMYLQNVYARPQEQGLSLALCIAEGILKDSGAWRVHGGGFAGTTLNFVPQDKLDEFIGAMEDAFGKGCCQILDIRPEGAAVIEL